MLLKALASSSQCAVFTDTLKVYLVIVVLNWSTSTQCSIRVDINADNRWNEVLGIKEWIRSDKLTGAFLISKCWQIYVGMNAGIHNSLTEQITKKVVVCLWNFCSVSLMPRRTEECLVIIRRFWAILRSFKICLALYTPFSSTWPTIRTLVFLEKIYRHC